MVWLSYILMTLLMFMGLFLIGLILLQRGRGGGLAGAFGGMGGQSAFGTKAGDVFTRITIGVATAWILLCAGSILALHNIAPRATGFAEESAKKDLLDKADPLKNSKTEETDEPQAPVGADEGKPDAPLLNDKKPEVPAKTEEAKPAAEVKKPEEKIDAAAKEEPKAEADKSKTTEGADKKPEEPKTEATPDNPPKN